MCLATDICACLAMIKVSTESVNDTDPSHKSAICNAAFIVRKWSLVALRNV